MTVLLFVAFVAAVLALEYVHRRSLAKAREEVADHRQPVIVRGVRISPDRAYHPYHTWVRRIDAQTVVIGVDDFARRLIGRPERVILPASFARLEAGQGCARMCGAGREVTIIAPLSGEVLEVNPALRFDPVLPFEDPYGEGWLFKVRNWRVLDQFAALLSGADAERWMSGSIDRLINSQPALAGAVSQDGGKVIDDLSQRLDRYEWMRAVREHLGGEPVAPR